MDLISLAELARRAGVTRSAVSTAIKNRTIPHVIDNGKKKIDADDKEVRHYLKGNHQREAKHEGREDVNPPTTKRKPKPKAKPSPDKKPEAKPAELVEQQPRTGIADEIKTFRDAKDFINNIPTDIYNLDKHELEKYKIAVNIFKEQANYNVKTEQYVERSLIAQFFKEIYQIDENQFLQLSSVLTGQICQEVFNTSDPEVLASVSMIIDTHLYNTQKHIKHTIDDYLDKIGAGESASE